MNKMYIKYIFFVMLLVFTVYFFFIRQPWMLSIYKDGKTVMRLDYKSREECLERGHWFRSQDKSIDRFDCSSQCRIVDKDDMLEGPICKKVIDPEY